MSTKGTVYCDEGGVHIYHELADPDHDGLYLEYADGGFAVTIPLPKKLSSAILAGLTPPLAALLAAKREWSERTFGPGLQTEAIVAHIRKECDEVLASPSDTAEHIDIALLAFDLYWRAGGCDLLADLWAKLRVNQARQWRTDGTGPVEHVRAAEQQEPEAGTQGR